MGRLIREWYSLEIISILKKPSGRTYFPKETNSWELIGKCVNTKAVEGGI